MSGEYILKPSDETHKKLIKKFDDSNVSLIKLFPIFKLSGKGEYYKVNSIEKHKNTYIIKYNKKEKMTKEEADIYKSQFSGNQLFSKPQFPVQQNQNPFLQYNNQQNQLQYQFPYSNSNSNLSPLSRLSSLNNRPVSRSNSITSLFDYTQDNNMEIDVPNNISNYSTRKRKLIEDLNNFINDIESKIHKEAVDEYSKGIIINDITTSKCGIERFHNDIDRIESQCIRHGINLNKDIVNFNVVNSLNTSNKGSLNLNFNK